MADIEHARGVDIAEWSTRFDLLSDPHRLEILLVLHRHPGIIVGDIAAEVGRLSLIHISEPTRPY